MLPETHPLIEAVTQPLADNAERRLAAHAFLEKTFDLAHPGAAEATARIEAAGRRKSTALRKASPWILASVVLGAAVAPWIRTIHITARMYDRFSFTSASDNASTLPAGLTEEQKLLLGDSDLDDLEQKKQLHILAPENPAYFAEYVQLFNSQRSALPPDFLGTAARIAPDNAYFPYFAAGQISGECLTKKKFSTPRPPPRIVDGVRLSALSREQEFDIHNLAAFEEALALVAKATALPGFETYTNTMTVAKVRLLPTGTMAEFTSALMYAYGGSTGMIQIMYTADLINARAEQFSKSGRKEEFIALAAQREALIAHLGRNPDMALVGELVHSIIASATAKNFEAAADRLGLTEMGDTYRKQREAFQAERDLRDIRKKKGKSDPFPEDKASSMHRLVLPMVERQVSSRPPLNDFDFEPMRRAEHELLGGLGVLSVALVIVFGALVLFLFRFAAAPMIRLPAKHMTIVLGITDWVWVIGLGVVVPILFFLIVTRLTPLGGRHYGAGSFLFLFPGLHLVALLFALLVAPATVVRWRLSKQLAPLGLWDRFTLPLTLAALAMLAVWSLVALPFVERFGIEKYSLIALAAPPALCLALVLANGLRAILGKPAVRLAQCTTAVAVLPAYAIAIIALCALTPIYSAGERHWIAKETLLRIDPDAPDLGAYEFKVAAQKRKETNAITGVE